MKKYKLIKEYPGSPNLGYIWEMYNGYKGDYHKYPDFWQEIIEKDYEILSFKDINDVKSNANIQKDGKYSCCDILTKSKGDTTLEEMFRLMKPNIFINMQYVIHSIKRLSDGEIFTIGDIIYSKDFKPTILERITTKGDNSLAMWGKYHSDMLGEIGLASCLIKKPLFTTEDGVDIYEGNKYFRVILNWTIQQENAIKLGEHIYKSYNILRFSTKKAAEEYIVMNRPCLSYNDLIESGIITGWDQQRIILLIKSKLNTKD